MLKINFFPSDYKNENRLYATYSYKLIWDTFGHIITKSCEKISGLKFKEKEIEALVHPGVSRSRPLTLDSRARPWGKNELLIHELLHLLFSGNLIEKGVIGENKLDTHKSLDLVLYDVWTEVFGKEFADWAVAYEKGFQNEAYKEAWDWALSFNKEERRAKFQEFVKKARVES